MARPDTGIMKMKELKNKYTLEIEKVKGYIINCLDNNKLLPQDFLARYNYLLEARKDLK